MDLVFDGNAFLNVGTSVVVSLLEKDTGFVDYLTENIEADKNGNFFNLSQEGKDFYRKFMINYLSSILSPFRSNVKKIYFVFDHFSWREHYMNLFYKKYPQKEKYEYKAQRKKDVHERNKRFTFFDDFRKSILPGLLDIPGIETIKVKGAEGDDIISYICQNTDNDIIIWSVDTDLTQLLKCDKQNIIMIAPKSRNKFKRLYISDDFSKVKDIEKSEDDVFKELTRLDEMGENYFDIKSFIDGLINQKDYKIYNKNPGIEVLVKIISGDGSDNIPSVFIYNDKKTNKPKRITEGRALKIIELLKDSYDANDFLNLIDEKDPEFLNKIIDFIILNRKLEPSQELRDEIWENLCFNIKLIWLSSKTIPTIIQERMSAKFQTTLNNKEFNQSEFVEYQKKFN